MAFILALLAGIISYLLGSISFAIIFTGLFSKKDVRKYGSGNAGMTNVMRVSGVLPGALTFICDVLKGFLGAFIGWQIFSYCYSLMQIDLFLPIYGSYFCAIACMLGHAFPIFFEFKGGKSVSVCLGVMFVCNWPAAVIAIFVFALILLVTKIVSISSMIAVASMLVTVPNFMMNSNTAFLLGGKAGLNVIILIFNIIMVSLVTIMHKDNIKRLKKGTEKSIFKKRDKNV